MPEFTERVTREGLRSRLLTAGFTTREAATIVGSFLEEARSTRLSVRQVNALGGLVRDMKGRKRVFDRQFERQFGRKPGKDTYRLTKENTQADIAANMFITDRTSEAFRRIYETEDERDDEMQIVFSNVRE
ncbi:hypothetical protein LCGC14_1155920 [marine sediment metagenome]|uniref:Uncharacterized protein n=1 Tax=marine sediment metagenome TaxID=412755 RepID=A0A0F9PZK6_9ZZZZ